MRSCVSTVSILIVCSSLVLASHQRVREDEVEAEREAKRDERSREYVEREFREYDKNGDGILDAADIRSRFGNALDPEMLFQFFADSDLDQTGTITLDEYLKYIQLVETRAAKKQRAPAV